MNIYFKSSFQTLTRGSGVCHEDLRLERKPQRPKYLPQEERKEAPETLRISAENRLLDRGAKGKARRRPAGQGSPAPSWRDLLGGMRGSERGNGRGGGSSSCQPSSALRAPPTFSAPRLAAGSPAETAAPHAGPARGHRTSARRTGPGVAGAPGPRARRRSSSGPLSRRAARWAVLPHRPLPPEL